MFSKISRYRKLQDVVTTDHKGRDLESKTLRLLPEASGTFLHTVDESDRLDHLAFKYYKQPRKWWRICDANPEFMSPQALLGKEQIVTTRFSLTFDGNGTQPTWSVLLRSLTEIVGVEDIRITEEVKLVEEVQTTDGEQVTVHAEQFDRSVIVVYNGKNVGSGELADVIASAGFEVGQTENIGRVGKQIVVPPDVVG